MDYSYTVPKDSHEIFQYLSHGIRFEPFLKKLLNPWLIGQAFYDKHGRWPFDDRAHDEAGIFQGFADILKIDDLKIVEQFTTLLIRNKLAQGHENCPCGSGRRLRNCHLNLYRECRNVLPDPALKIYRNYFKSKKK